VAKITIDGLEQTMKALRGLDAKVAKPILRKQMRAGCYVFLKEAKANCPVRTGALRDSLVVRAGRRSRRFFSINVATGVGGKSFTGKFWYGAMQEFGTSRTPAVPYLRPGFDNKVNGVKSDISHGLASALNSFKVK
jgi:HK97 gp10 family phage protein